MSAFLNDRRGNFGTMMAILAIPCIMAVGLATDYATMTRVRSHMQNVTDAAALAVARDGSVTSQTQAETTARKYIDANLGSPYRNLKVVRKDTRVSVSIMSNAGLGFTGIFGYDVGNITTISTAEIGVMGYEIGLILDTTGSMKGGKLAAMKDAVNGMIDTMSSQITQPGKLKFSLVPFATFVNVGPQYGPKFDSKGRQVAGDGAKWLDLAGATNVAQSELATGVSRFQLYSNVDRTWPGCVETRQRGATHLDVSDEAPDASRPETLFVPAFAIDEPDTSDYENSYIRSNVPPRMPSVAEQRKRWRKYGVETKLTGEPLDGGVVGLLLGILKLGKRIIPIDSSLSDGEEKGPGYGCTMQPITPLTSNFTELKKKVNALTASGNTNITEGVAWGMRVLSPGEPFTEGAPATAKTIQKVMIVLTDGTNVFGLKNNDMRSSYSSNGYMIDGRLGMSSATSAVSTAALNARTLAACQAAKDQNMDVYTIKLEEPDVATGTMLRNCASSPDKYIDVPNRAKLDEVFKNIIDKVTMVRLAS